MTPSSNDIALLRGNNHALHPVLNGVPLVSVATAQVNQSVFTYPLGALAVDNWNGIGSVKIGQMVFIGSTPGAADVTAGVVRLNPTNSILYIDGKSLGDPGYPRSIINPLANDLYVTVYKFRPGWGLLSAIRKGVFYKQFDLAYSGQGLNPYPVPLMGGWRQAFAGSGTGSADLTFSSSGSFAWGSRTIVSYLWDLDGGDAVGGSINSETVIGRFPPGFYEVTLTVTDSVGRSRTGYRYVWVNSADPDSVYAPFNWKYPTQISSDKQGVTGRELTLEMFGDFDSADAPYPGQGWHLNEYPTFNGERLEDESNIVHEFAGYASERAVRTAYNARQTTITVQSPLMLAKSVPTASQEMLETATPKNWAEVGKVLSNPPGAAWYIAALHSPYLIDGHDFTFDPTLLLLRRQIFQFLQADAGSQLNTLAEMFTGVIGNKSDGRLRMVRNPNYFELAARSDNELFWNWQPRDISGQLERAFSWRMKYGQTHGYAFSYGGGKESTPYESLAPGYGKAQAPGVQNVTPFIVKHADGLIARPNIVDKITGHLFAAQNDDKNPFTIKTTGNMDIAEPVDIDKWHVMDLPATYDPMGEGWLNQRAIVTRVSRSWKHEAGAIKNVQVEFTNETFGQPGTPVPVNRGGANNPENTGWNPGVTEVYQPIIPDFGLDIPILLAWNDSGLLARTVTFLEPGVGWFGMNELDGAFTGAVVDVSLDYESPYFTDPADPLRAWILTNDGGSLKVWLCSDVFAGLPIFDLMNGAGYAAGDTFNGRGRIIHSREESGFICIAWKNRAGVYVGRSTDSGTSWGAAIPIGATPLIPVDSEHDAESVGFTVADETQVIIAPTGATDTDGQYIYQPYKATAKGGAFTVVANVPADYRALPGFAQAFDSTDVYVSMEKLGTPTPPDPLSPVTFDVGGYPDYIVNGAGVTGVPGAMYAWQSTNQPNVTGGVGLSVDVDLVGDYVVSNVSFGYTFQFNGTAENWYTIHHITSYDAEDNLISDYRVISPVTPSSSGGAGGTFEANAEKLKLTEAVRRVNVSSQIFWTTTIGGGIWYAFIDDIDIEGILVTESASRRLYDINPGAGVWNNDTPARPHLPNNTYAMTVDYPAATTYRMIAKDEGGYPYLYRSPSWQKVAKSSYEGLKLTTGGLIMFGFNGLGFSPDNSIIYNRLGNWISAVGAVGEIRGVTGVL